MAIDGSHELAGQVSCYFLLYRPTQLKKFPQQRQKRRGLLMDLAASVVLVYVLKSIAGFA